MSQLSDFISYMNATLIDSESSSGCIYGDDDSKFFQCSIADIQKKVLPKSIVSQMFVGLDQAAREVDFRFFPMVYKRKSFHGEMIDHSVPKYILPFAVDGKCALDGSIMLSTFSIPRDLLLPGYDGAYYLTTVEEFDAFSTENSGNDSRFDFDFLKNKISRAYTLFVKDNEFLKDYQRLKDGVQSVCWIANRSVAGVSEAIKSLYSDAKKDIESGDVSEDQLRLLQTFLNVLPSKDRVLEDTSSTFSDRIAHSSDVHPLADHQRLSISHLIGLEEGSIEAVNGPPGTGKTTMLLSLIANEWTRAAIAGEAPPVIMAASANNQAVTNVIDAFEKDFGKGGGAFSGRWLPGIKSYGSFFPSQSKLKDYEDVYQTINFFKKVENPDYLAKAKAFFMSKFFKAFPDLEGKIETPQACASYLRELLVQRTVFLKDFERALGEEKLILQEYKSLYGDKNANEISSDLQYQLAETESEIEVREKDLRGFQIKISSESLLIDFLSFMGPIKKYRDKKRYNYVLENVEDIQGVDYYEERDMHLFLNKRIESKRLFLNSISSKIELLDKVLRSYRQVSGLKASAALGLGLRDAEVAFEDIDRALDIDFRFLNFKIATHYWEARWLCEFDDFYYRFPKAFTHNYNFEDFVIRKWKMRMMLTPCAVATIYSLPRYFQYYQGPSKGGGVSSGKKGASYLYGFIDLLIFDESGQAPPYVAAGAFALAKRSVCIGDTRQIEPISNIHVSVDYANAKNFGLLGDDHSDASYQRFSDSGRSSGGSVMHVAQQSSSVYPYPDLEKGLFLFEHRRCNDEIIQYCNDLSYKGRLIPKKGVATDGFCYAPMSYCHVDGRSQASGSSRVNKMEAEVIVDFLIKNKSRIEEFFEKPIEEAVAVISPFKSQAMLVRRLLRKTGLFSVFGDKAMVVNTVHTLQGAERDMVLFTTASSFGDSRAFIDSSASLLNVAVSRAKRCFMLFGDMNFLSDADLSSPTRLLYEHLTRSIDQDVSFFYKIPSSILSSSVSGKSLSDYKEHDEFLNSILLGDLKKIEIVSPWCVPNNVYKSGFLENAKQAVGRGAHVLFYVDEKKTLQFLSKNSTLNEAQEKFDKFREVCLRQGVTLVMVSGIHAKLVLTDTKLSAVGSFNWLSASRDDRFADTEVSSVSNDKDVADKLESVIRKMVERSSDQNWF